LFLGFFYYPSAALKIASSFGRQVNQIIQRLEKIGAGDPVLPISFLPRLHKAKIAAKNCHG